MNIDELRKILSDAGLNITDEHELGNNTGTQFRLSNQSIINIFNNGNYNVQGKNKEETTRFIGCQKNIMVESKPTYSATVKKVDVTQRKVFVVYGHDSVARDQLEAMLRRWSIEPIILDQLASEGQTIIEKLESYTDEVNFAVVLATPDDEGYRIGKPDEKAFRVRQNVVLELGMLLSNLGRSKVAILIKNPLEMERPSDIQGLIYIPFTENIAKEAGVLLAKEMEKQGINISVSCL